MARLFEKYTEENPPIVCFMPDSKWFKQSGAFTPKGILIHDTGADNEWLKRYVQPADDDPNREQLLAIIGKNTYGNDWEHGGKDKDAGLNAWIGKTQSGQVTTLQAGPWNKRPWGCGSQKRNGVTYSLNDTHIQWEICEDAKDNVEYFGDVYEETIEVCAFLCKKYSIDPLGTITYKGITVPTICCHYDAYTLGCGSGHGDIYDWTALYDYLGIPKSKVNTKDVNNLVMQRIRADIKKAMEEPQPEPGKTGWVKKDGKWFYYVDGVMIVNDFVLYRGDTYYFGADGAMLTGWQTIGGKTRYFFADGRGACAEWVEGHFLGQDGIDTGDRGAWKKNSKGKWYQDERGWYPKARTISIDGTEYTFDNAGYLNE